MPVVCKPYIDYMLDQALGFDACVTLKGGRYEPFCAFYSKRVLPELEQSLSRGKTSLYYFLQSINTKVIPEEQAGEIVSLDIDEENGKASVVTVPSAPLKTDCKAAGAAMRFSVDGLRKNLDEFYSSSELFYTTGAVHRSALCSDNGMILDAVDISRHNTLDKLVGKALRSGIDLKACYCILSGRVHLDVVKKILVSGIPLLVSRSAPSINALEEAKLHSLGLVGFARSNRFNIYCGREMLIF